jgi:hypothetical protein|tara:strand:+ start:277 stop:513 length:237 start_codon:yes stop_codon:yes gene_type:complete
MVSLSKQIANLDKLANKETDSTKKKFYMDEAIKLLDIKIGNMDEIKTYKDGGLAKKTKSKKSRGGGAAIKGTKFKGVF